MTVYCVLLLCSQGTVAAAVRELEERLQEALESRVAKSMKSDIVDLQKSVKGDLREYVSRIASEAGLLPVEGETVSKAQRVTAARQGSEREVAALISKVEDLSIAVVSMQDRIDDSDRAFKASFTSVEKLTDEAVAVATSSSREVRDRAALLEDVVRRAAVDAAKTQAALKGDLLERLR